jgi:hypothetical protein
MTTTVTPALRRLPVGGQGPEDVVILHDRLVTGVADGRLLSVALDGNDVDVVADTGGRVHRPRNSPARLRPRKASKSNGVEVPLRSPAALA